MHRQDKEHAVPDALPRSVLIIDRVTPESSDEKASDDPLSPSLDKWYENMKIIVNQNPRKYSAWRINSDKLYKQIPLRYPEFIPRSDRRKLIQEVHNTLCHAGVFKTFHILCQRYY